MFLSVDGAIYGFAISNFVLCSRYLKAVKQLDFSISSIASIKNYFLHSYMIGIAKVLPYFADKLLILPLFDVVTVGYYQFGAQIASFSSLVPFILFGYLLPRQSQGVTHELHNTKRLGIVFSIGLTIILFLLMPFIVNTFFPKFQPATTATQIIILSGVPLSFSAIYNSGFLAIGRSLPVVIGTMMFLISQFLLIYFLGNIYSLVGLSFATVTASTLQCGFMYYCSKAAQKKQ
jgi:O-antigen/teichoic acid export membrane protein